MPISHIIAIIILGIAGVFRLVCTGHELAHSNNSAVLDHLLALSVSAATIILLVVGDGR